MRPRRVTLLQVAERAGVSRTTASFVLSGRRAEMRISDEAGRRVRAAAEVLGYRPNRLSRGLRTQVTHTIGLVSDTIASEPFAGAVISGAVAAAMDRDHVLLVVETSGDATTEDRLVRDLLDRQVDGFLYACTFTREVDPPPLLAGHGLVLVNCVAPGSDLPSVVPDEYAAGRDAGGVLLEAGHRHGIYVVGEPAPAVVAGRDRLAGITDALSGAGLSLQGVLDCRWWPEPAFEATNRFLAAGGRAQAMVCLNDRVAMGVYQACAARGLAIPGDVSVVSFDDSFLASWLRPGLTSLALPHDQLGRTAVELLLGGEPASGTVRLPMAVRRRDSVRAPARLDG